MLTEGGTPKLDPNSPTCQDAFARITRFASGGNAGQISSIRVNPINIAREKTSGIDIAFRGSLPTGIGTFTLSLAHSPVSYTHLDVYKRQHRFTATGGWTTDRFSIAAGIEYLDQRPLWAYDRSIQDLSLIHI